MASYLWENYIEISNATHIFMLGVGFATSGIISLLNAHERTSDRVNCIFNFIAEQTLVGVNRPADDTFPSWYHQHSMVFVAENHQVWMPERARKLRKKYGYLLKSGSTNLNDMLLEHKHTVFNKLLEEVEDWKAQAGKQLNGHVYSPERMMESKVSMTDMDRSSVSSPIKEVSTPDRLGRIQRLGTPGNEDRSLTARLSGSPNPATYSPGRMPPLGVFSVTTPDKNARESRDGLS